MRVNSLVLALITGVVEEEHNCVAVETTDMLVDLRPQHEMDTLLLYPSSSLIQSLAFVLTQAPPRERESESMQFVRLFYGGKRWVKGE